MSDIGMEEGDTCGRYPEPDEDQPRGYRPKPCQGVMGYEPVEGCSCHISPPCNDCVDHGNLREAIADAESYIKIQNEVIA